MTKQVQTPAVTLYSGMSNSQTTARVVPFPVDLDGNKLTMSDFGSIGYITIDPKVLGFEEIASFSGLVDNGDNTGTLTGLVRNLTSKAPYTTPGTGKQHGSSALVVISSDNPQLLSRYAAKDNDEYITGQWTFQYFPITPSNSLATNTVAGILRLSAPAANAAIPIAVGDNDPRLGAYANDTGGANAYVIAPTNAPTSYTNGQLIAFKALTANTGASTINVNSLGAKTIKKFGSVDLAAGDIIAGQVYELRYDGTNFQMVSPFGTFAGPIVTVFTANATWTKPSGLKYVEVEAVGGGRGGQGGGSSYGAAQGGISGAYAKKTIKASDITTTTVAITIGIGGTGGANNTGAGVGSLGGLGANTTFGSIMTALGGGQTNSDTTGHIGADYGVTSNDFVINYNGARSFLGRYGRGGNADPTQYQTGYNGLDGVLIIREFY